MRRCWVLLVALSVAMFVSACGSKQPRNQAEAMEELERIKKEARGDEFALTTAEKKEAEEEFARERAQLPKEVTDQQVRDMVESKIKARKAMAALKASQQSPEYKNAQAQMQSYMTEEHKENYCYRVVTRIDNWKESAVHGPEFDDAEDKEKFVQDYVATRMAKRERKCMSGGNYVTGKIGEDARCTKHGTSDESRPSFD